MDEFHQHVLECLVPVFVKSIGLHQEVNTILNRWLYAVALSSAVLLSQYRVYVHSALPVDGMGLSVSALYQEVLPESCPADC